MFSFFVFCFLIFTSAFELLLQNGANHALMDDDDKTARELAMENDEKDSADVISILDYHDPSFVPIPKISENSTTNSLNVGNGNSLHGKSASSLDSVNTSDNDDNSNEM